MVIYYFSVLQIIYLGDEDIDDETLTIETNFDEYLNLLKDKRILIASLVICISTSTMAILEPCVPMWLLAKYDPPPTRWQLGAVFIPDSFGYFIGSHFTGKFYQMIKFFSKHYRIILAFELYILTK